MIGLYFVAKLFSHTRHLGLRDEGVLEERSERAPSLFLDVAFRPKLAWSRSKDSVRDDEECLE